MCGLVGISGKLEFRDEATMKRLLIYDYFRGPDSTGFAALRNDGTCKVAKIPRHPLDLFDTKGFNEALSGWNSTVFLGHNRLATKGKVNYNNSHPYEYDHIVGAHNGTLEQSSWRAIEEAVGDKFDVDSQAVIACIAKLGIEATVPLLQGAWALVWIDMKEGTLNFLRNKERPFWYAYSEEFDKIFWASEWPMIDAALKLSTQPYKLATDPEKGYKFYQSQENWWYRIDVNELKKGSATQPKPRVKVLKGKEPTPVVTYSNGATSPFHRHGHHGPKTSMTSTGFMALEDKREVKDNVTVLQVDATKAKPFGNLLSKQEFDKIAKYGCAWCQSDVEFDEPGVQVYQEQDMVLCPNCTDNDGVSRIYVNSSKLVG